MRHFFNLRCAVLFIAAFLLPSCAYSQHNKYFFQLLEGEAELSRTSGASWVGLSRERVFELKPEDIIALRGSGRGELRFPNGTSVRLKNKAIISLHRYSISIQRGYAWLSVMRSADVFRVFTPLGSLSVLGTSFDVEVDNFGKAVIRVFEGIVAVRAEADARKRQLVLQRGMKTRLDDKNRVDDAPTKFGYASELSAITAEWGKRKAREFNNAVNALTNWHKKPLNQELKPATDADKLKPYRSAEAKRQTMARQRNEFSEMLANAELERGSVVGGAYLSEKKIEDMQNAHFGQEFGESPYKRHLSAGLTQNDEYTNDLYGKLLRLQLQIRQTELKIEPLISKGALTAAGKIKVSMLQARLLTLQSEHKILRNMLRERQSQRLMR